LVTFWTVTLTAKVWPTPGGGPTIFEGDMEIVVIGSDEVEFEVANEAVMGKLVTIKIKRLRKTPLRTIRSSPFIHTYHNATWLNIILLSYSDII
jgi:hypothetical protein